MFPYTRLNEIFDYVNNHHYISAQKLSTILNITERTIRSDIQAINDVLEQHGACIKLKRKSGYYIEVYDEQLYREFLYAFLEHQSVSLNLDSSEERIKYVLNILLYQNDYISLDDLALSVYISRNTLQNYIKTIKSILEKYNLEYISKYHYGVKIIGNEEDKRKCLMDCVLSRNTHNYIIGFSKSEYALFEGINLDYIKNIVTKYLNNIEGITDDLNFKNLIIHFALMISRIQNDCYIHFHNLVIIPEDIKPFIDDICHDIEEHFHIMISEGEKKYMYLHTVSNTHFKSDNVNDIHIKQIIHDLLEMIYMDYNFDLRNDDILIKDLFNHFKSILTTKSYAINKRNPLLNTIKTNFPLSFEITFNVVSKIFNREPYVLTEDEIGYVSLHIGAAIERCFHGSIQRKNVLLVCGTGQATTRMLEARLDVFFNDKINIIHKMSYNTFCSLKPQDFKNIDFVKSKINAEKNFNVKGSKIHNIDAELKSFLKTNVAPTKIEIFLIDNQNKIMEKFQKITDIKNIHIDPNSTSTGKSDSPEGMLLGKVDIDSHKSEADTASPVTYVSREKPIPPILIATGTCDHVLPFSQSEILVDALEKAEKEHVYYVLKGADHGSWEFWSPEMLDLVEQFIQKYIR